MEKNLAMHPGTSSKTLFGGTSETRDRTANHRSTACRARLLASCDTIFAMKSDPQSNAPAGTAHPFTSADILAILRERGWLTRDPTPEIDAWCAHAAAILGAHTADRAALVELFGLVFHYDAREILARVQTHEVLARYAARDVLRHLALLLLDGGPLNSERFKEFMTTLKEQLQLPGRELLYPIRLALAGRGGDGSLDRVILLLDEAAPLNFAVPVKSARARILEFCAALD
jgi:hypothetical protein